MENFIENIQFTNIWWALALPAFLMMMDIITGYYSAWKNNEISSSKMRDGLGKKLAELVYIAVGIILKFSIGASPIMYFIIIYVAYMEIVSLAENCDKLGVEFPKQLNDKLNNKKD